MSLVAQRFYYFTSTDAELPFSLGHGLTLRTREDVTPFTPESEDRPTPCVCVTVDQVEERNFIQRLAAFENALNYHSDLEFSSSYTCTISGHTNRERGVWESFGDANTINISREALEFASRTVHVIEALTFVERFCRVSNALRLYYLARVTAQPDLALLACIGCLESMFSISTSELTFRLSLTISKFLHDAPEEQLQMFRQVKELYSIRSKVAHGDKVHDDEERAAIMLTDHWVPVARDLCRRCIHRMFEFQLSGDFNQKRNHQHLMEALVFAPNLPAALLLPKP